MDKRSKTVILGSLFFLFSLVISLAAFGVVGAIEGSETHDFESLTVVVVEGEQVISGSDAVIFRYGIDLLGDNDSIVGSSDVSNYEFRYESYAKEHTNEYTLNGVEGNFTNLVVTFKNAEGNVNDTSALTFEFQGRVRFTGLDTDVDSFTYRVVNEGGGNESLVVFRLTVPSGYEITGTQGFVSPTISQDKRTVSGNPLPEENIIIEFEKSAWEYEWMLPYLMLSAIISLVVILIIYAANYTNLFLKSNKPPEPPQSPPPENE